MSLSTFSLCKNEPETLQIKDDIRKVFPLFSAIYDTIEKIYPQGPQKIAVLLQLNNPNPRAKWLNCDILPWKDNHYLKLIRLTSSQILRNIPRRYIFSQVKQPTGASKWDLEGKVLQGNKNVL